jgi:glutathione peroxidase
LFHEFERLPHNFTESEKSVGKELITILPPSVFSLFFRTFHAFFCLTTIANDSVAFNNIFHTYSKEVFRMKKIMGLLASIATLLSCNPKEIRHRPDALTQKASISNSSTTTITMKNLYDFKATSLDGKEVDLAQFKGKKVIILNVASECGYTPQYANWEAFYQKNKEKVVVLGFPCNQFGGQESGSNTEIQSFCQKNYGVSFPMFSKVDVKGKNQSPLYTWLTDKEANGWCDKAPSWNFCKYVVNEKGELQDFFASAILPTDSEFEKAMAK